MSSRAEIRRALALELPGVVVATAGTSSTSQLNDPDDDAVLYTGDGGDDYTGYWLIRADAAVAGDRVRRVAIHNKDEGYVRPSRIWSNAPTSETYELYPPDFTPQVLDNSLNIGLRKLPYIVEEELEIEDNTNTYTLAYDWLDHERQVLEVYKEITSSSGVVRAEWPWFKVTPNGGVFTLRIFPIPHSMTGAQIIIEGRAFYEGLSTDAAETDAPLDWAMAAMEVQLYRQLRNRTLGQDTSRWSAELRDAQQRLTELSKRYAPRRGRRIMPRTPIKMPRSI